MAGMDTYTSKSREEMAMRLGVDKYIRKDGSIKQITNAIKEVFEN